LVDLDKGGFRAGERYTAIRNPASNGIPERRFSNDVDFRVGGKTEIEEALPDGSGCVMAVDFGPSATFDIVQHTAVASVSSSFFATMPGHMGLHEERFLQTEKPQYSSRKALSISILGF
jgi:hypothetical protein